MSVFIASAEGLVENANVTLAASGASPALDFVTPNTGTIKATTVNPIKGAVSYSVVPAAGVAELCCFGWTSMTPSNSVTYAFTVKLLGLPSVATQIARLTNAGDTARYLNLVLNTNGTLVLQDTGSATVFTSTGALVVGTTYRFEGSLSNAANPGTAILQVFTGADATVATANLSTVAGGVTGNFGTTAPARYAVGKVGTTTATWLGAVFDSVRIDTGTTALLGPVILTEQAVAPASDITTSGTTTTGGTGTAASAIDEATPDFTDYVTVPAGSTLEVKLANLSIPTDKTGWRVNYGLRAGSGGTTVTTSLVQGTTVIATDVARAAPATDTLYGFPITPAQAANVTDGTDLRLRFVAA